jgi:hypothetical protein
MRIKAIDCFRGLSIILMVFFSLILRLGTLPDLLAHNEPGALHLGDFVLPMFLFASGMSLVFFAEKRRKEGRGRYLLDVVERTGKLVLIWLFLSPFSSGEFLGMDELMLSAMLFIPTLLLLRTDWKVIAAVALIPPLLYLALLRADALPDFTAHYLGGYPAAVFYLPVMLAGALAGKRLDRVGWLFAASLALSALLLLLAPPYKMSASPSFMALSVAFSSGLFMLAGRLGSGFLEYLGRRPIRYWVLMFLLFIIPADFYVLGSGGSFPLGFSWEAAVIISALFLAVFYGASLAIDRIRPSLGGRP